MIISVDFDGVLHFGTYPEIGHRCNEALRYLTKLHDEGHYIILNTCRCGEALIDAVNWVLEQRFPIDRVNDNAAANILAYGSNARKINADVYIDDKNVGGLPDWSEIYRYITEEGATWKHQV